MNETIRVILVILTIRLLAPLSCIAATSGANLTNPRCEYLTDPLGIDVGKPRLSWVILSACRGARQTAYQVLVASAPELLAKNQGECIGNHMLIIDDQYDGPA